METARKNEYGSFIFSRDMDKTKGIFLAAQDNDTATYALLISI